MSLSRYQESTVVYSESAMNAAWSSQCCEYDVAIDYSIPGNRLHRRIDGTLEVMPKPPGVVLGELVLRPLIDTTYQIATQTFKFVKDSFLCVDHVLSRGLNFLPGAAANPIKGLSTLEVCTGANMQEAYRATEVAILENNPKMMEAAHTLYGPFFEQCFKDETYQKALVIYEKNLATHREHYAKYEKALKACTDVYGIGYCYPHNPVEGRPDMFPVETHRIVNDQSLLSTEWKASQGYLSWSIYGIRWYWRDPYHDQGSYNYDTSKSKPTVPTRHEIESNHHAR